MRIGAPYQKSWLHLRQNLRNFYVWLISFQPIKKQCFPRAEDRTFSRTCMVRGQGLELRSQAKNFKMCSQSQGRPQGLPTLLNIIIEVKFSTKKRVLQLKILSVFPLKNKFQKYPHVSTPDKSF